ncbi:addiction module antitoxin RelB [Bartonella henselae]|uniref:type II toxin-antitoxin system RelE/ParE family toxin n=1 Tax=Bartonella henselae TaxID=38323 RepID=UPI00095C5FA4|nr:type II toxin-antitoxin system RelE/ParE family toxin [Bartonella henselae]MDM9997339.1 type II toxin-antitoxin system RelE/ParE family toxin [Bartonella henselae]OLL47913.1 addiction module antitoxin RelB [Bartonella henselae]OLL50561.1 addiction module antitoxin RelB [Bartonella henselae]OLL51081.1 addiction module antitoxin RelB [Bartonella henselae]OLL57891.1 addiction module antitoxin RelB [Bartonella henselae]
MVIIRKTREFDTWLEKLKDKSVKTIILQRVARLRQGLLGDVKFFNNIGELRIHYGAGYRIHFTQEGSEFILLLCGGDKSTQKKDIEQALKLKEEYQ